MIEKYLNIRYSTRNLSDEEFEKILPVLVEELKDVDYHVKYDDKVLKNDWHKLCQWDSNEFTINSTSRIGLKLCEHFFYNFYNIKTNKNKSFSEMWKDESLLKKILIWNRKSHSTPYLSELKRGIYFCGGIVKSTMYRPQLAKLVTKGRKVVFDPCAGWGGRMLGSVANGCDYYAFEPNIQTYNNLMSLSKFLNIESKVHIFCDDARNMNKHNLSEVDCILTSPPYFDLEIYSDEDTQSVHNTSSYEDWVNNFLQPVIESSVSFLIDGGISCWNVAKIKQGNMWEDVMNIHNNIKYSQIHEYSVISSRRQTSGTGKTYDLTKCFSKA